MVNRKPLLTPSNYLTRHCYKPAGDIDFIKPIAFHSFHQSIVSIIVYRANLNIHLSNDH